MYAKAKTNCMRCGREIEAPAAFCPDCLADMATHPVAPSTPVHIPPAPPAPTKRAPARRIRKPEEQLRNLRYVVIWLSIVIVLLLSLSIIVISMLINRLNNTEGGYRPGQNYNTTETIQNADQLFHVKHLFDDYLC